MRKILSYSLFESGSGNELTPKQIDFLDKAVSGKWEINPSTGLVDIEGDFVVSARKVVRKLPVALGTITGNFEIANNVLGTLEGFPKSVGGDFSCSGNELTTLKGGPEEVGGNYICSHNKLRDLEGSPKQIIGNFICYTNNLLNLKGGPEKIGGNFIGFTNEFESLEGAPEEVGGIFDCGVFRLKGGEWNAEGWIEAFKNGDGAQRKLILSLPEMKRLKNSSALGLIIKYYDIKDML